MYDSRHSAKQSRARSEVARVLKIYMRVNDENRPDGCVTLKA